MLIYNIVVGLDIILILVLTTIIIKGGIKMFGRKINTETPEYKAQKAEAEKTEATKVESVIGRKNPFVKELPPIELPSVEPPTTAEIIAGNTELWYKTQILEGIAEIVERLRSYDEPNKKP